VVEAAGRQAIVWVAQEYRYMPPVAEMLRMAHAGAVGRVHQVAIREHREPFYPKVDDWNRFSANTGGTLVEKCCHYFNLMDLVLQEKPVSVYASGAQRVNHLNESYAGRTPDILDSAYVIVEYPSGARAMLDLCMFAENSVDSEQIVIVGRRKTRTCCPFDAALRAPGRLGNTPGMGPNHQQRQRRFGAPHLGHEHQIHQIIWCLLREHQKLHMPFAMDCRLKSRSKKAFAR
jgi:predicted dehydrogenase